MLALWKKSNDQPRQHIIKQRHYFANKGPSGQGYGFSSSHAGMSELDYKESLALKNWCFWSVVLEKTLESPLNCKKILKEISLEYSLEGLSWSWNSNTLAFWCEELNYLTRPWCWKRLKAGGEGDDGMRWLDGITYWISLSKLQSWWWTEKPGVLQSMWS